MTQATTVGTSVAAPVPASAPTERSELAAGVRAMAPMLLAYAPFGLLVGAAVATSQSPWAAWLSTWTIYGGAAHLAVLDVLHQHTGVLGAAVVGLLVNARMVAYSVSLAPHWRGSSTASKMAAAAMLTDATWGLTLGRSTASAAGRRRFYFGAGLTLWFGWPALVSIGLLVGDWVQAVPAARLLPCLTLGSLAVRQLRGRPALAAGAAAVVTAVATTGLDGGVALLLCAGTGTVAATLVHRSSS